MKASGVASLKVAELKEALRGRRLSSTGTKAVLAERLLIALAAEESKGSESPLHADSADASADPKGDQEDAAAKEDKDRSSEQPKAPDQPADAAANAAESGVNQDEPTSKPGTGPPTELIDSASKSDPPPVVKDKSEEATEAADNVTSSDDAAAKDTSMADVQPQVLAPPETEHEEQVDYGTDDLVAVDELAEEAQAAEELKPTHEGAAEQQRQQQQDMDTDIPAAEIAEPAEKETTAAPINASSGSTNGEVGSLTPAVIKDSAASEDTDTVDGVVAGAPVNRSTAKAQGSHAADGPIAEQRSVAPDPTPPAGGSGRKRQPIEFKADEVQQRVAAKRAARDSAADSDTTALAAGKGKSQPASARKAPGVSEGEEQVPAVVVVVEPPHVVDVVGAKPSPMVVAAAVGDTVTDRAPKLQKLDSAGRKAGVVDGAEVPAAKAAVAAGVKAGPVMAAAAKKAVAPPPPLKGPVTRALRIDGFVRPFTENQIRQFLSQFGMIEDLWMPSIKKYCYVVFTEEAHAEEAATATNGVIWPPTNTTSILKPTYIAIETAAASIANGRSGLADTPKGPAAGSMASPRGLGAPQPSPAVAAVRRDTLTVAVAAAAADAVAAKQKASVAAGAAAVSNGVVTGRKRTEPEAEAPAAAATAVAPIATSTVDVAAPEPVAEPPALMLDDLFKKTTSKPVIYWLPLTGDEAVASRKKRKEEEEVATQKAEEEAEREGARRQQDLDRERERERAREGDRGQGGLPLPPPPPLPGPPRDGRGAYDRDRQGYGRDRR